MGSFFLQKGLVIQHLGQTLEYASRCGEELYFDCPETGARVTILESVFWQELQGKCLSIIKAFSSPTTLTTEAEESEDRSIDLASLPSKYLLDLERKVTYISRLKEAGISRGQRFLISDSAKRIAKDIDDPHGAPGSSTIQRWWKEFENSNCEAYRIISGHADRKRQKKVDAPSEQYLQDHIEANYLTREQPTAAGAFRDYTKTIKLENKKRLAASQPMLIAVRERTYYQRIDTLPKEEVMIARLGREAARHHFKMIKGHLPADYPLDVVEIDHTPLNLFVLDDKSFLPLGRPWLTAIKDRYSGVLLGFYISFQATGLDSIFGAIKHSLWSHQLAYELWPELENSWPTFGRAHYYCSDRGADFLSPRYRAALLSLGSFYEYCERRTPWLKGSVERFFLTLEQTFFESMSGRTYASLEKRGDYHPEKDAVVRFSTLVFLLHKWAADFHNIFPNKRKQARPIDLWTEGIGDAPPPYPVSSDELNIILGTHQTGKLSQEGIRFQWLTYADEGLSAMMKDVGKNVDVEFVVSREDLGEIHVRHPRSKIFQSVVCTRPEYAKGLSLFQHKFLRHEAGKRLSSATAVDTLAETRAHIHDTIQEDIEKKNNATKVRLARVAGINSNSVLQGTIKSVTDVFDGQSVHPTETSAHPEPALINFTNVPNYSWGI